VNATSFVDQTRTKTDENIVEGTLLDEETQFSILMFRRSCKFVKEQEMDLINSEEQHPFKRLTSKEELKVTWTDRSRLKDQSRTSHLEANK